MTYTKHDALDDAFSDAVTGFLNNLSGEAERLILKNCAGQYRDAVDEILDDDIAWLLLRAAFHQQCTNRYGKKSAHKIDACVSSAERVVLGLTREETG